MDKYQIIIDGHLNRKRFMNFEGMEIVQMNGGRTRLTGELDQSALHAVLSYIRDLGLTLILVEKIE